MGGGPLELAQVSACLCFALHSVCSSSLHSCLNQLCMCYMGRADVHFMPCACCLLTQLVCPQGVYDPGREKAEKAAVWCLVTLVGRALGPRVIMGLAWSQIDQNLGLQARLAPTCCTGGHHCNNSITIIRVHACAASQGLSVGRAAPPTWAVCHKQTPPCYLTH
jgi:hypothetical protein